MVDITGLAVADVVCLMVIAGVVIGPTVVDILGSAIADVDSSPAVAAVVGLAVVVDVAGSIVNFDVVFSIYFEDVTNPSVVDSELLANIVGLSVVNSVRSTDVADVLGSDVVFCVVGFDVVFDADGSEVLFDAVDLIISVDVNFVPADVVVPAVSVDMDVSTFVIDVLEFSTGVILVVAGAAWIVSDMVVKFNLLLVVVPVFVLSDNCVDNFVVKEVVFLDSVDPKISFVEWVIVSEDALNSDDVLSLLTELKDFSCFVVASNVEIVSLIIADVVWLGELCSVSC